MQVDDPEIQAHVDAVTREIHSAFGKTKHPGAQHLVRSPASCDGEEIRNDFGKQHWRDLPYKTILYHREAFGWLLPAAYVFYLPAYMLAAMRSDPGVDDIRIYTIYALAPRRWDEPSEVARFEERYQLLTEPQRSAVRSFLGFIHEHHEGYRGERAFDRRRSVWMRPA